MIDMNWFLCKSDIRWRCRKFDLYKMETCCAFVPDSARVALKTKSPDGRTERFLFSVCEANLTCPRAVEGQTAVGVGRAKPRLCSPDPK